MLTRLALDLALHFVTMAMRKNTQRIIAGLLVFVMIAAVLLSIVGGATSNSGGL